METGSGDGDCVVAGGGLSTLGGVATNGLGGGTTFPGVLEF